MRKIFSNFFTLFASLFIYGQDITESFILPTVSSIPQYIDAPISISTGIPDIRIPMLVLPTHNRNFKINLGISYHPNNTFYNSPSSDIGLGWSLYGSTSIIIRDTHEYSLTPTRDYYYNIFGRTGRFQYDNGILKKVTVDKMEITPVDLGGNLYSFVVKDSAGFVYHFEKLGIGISHSSYHSTNYTDAFHISKVSDANGLELLHFDYEEDHFPEQTLSGNKYLKRLKIKKITSPNYGSVTFDYSFDAANRKTLIDPFTLQSIELKNTSGKSIEKYVLQNQTSSREYRRNYNPGRIDGVCGYETQFKLYLNVLLKYDKNNSNPQAILFHYAEGFDDVYWTPAYDEVYQCFVNEMDNPYHLGKALLKSITFPTGMKIVYEFEPNQYFVNKNDPDYLLFEASPHLVKDREIQTYEDITTINFDTTNPSTTGTFVLPSNPDLPGGESYLEFWTGVDEYYNGPYQMPDGSQFMNFSFTSGITSPYGYTMFLPGTTPYHIAGTGGKGNVQIKRIRYKSMPVPNHTTGNGIRIKTIKYFDNNILIEPKTIHYTYQDFNDHTKTSGFKNELDEKSPVVYKHIKETYGSGGYKKYFFKTSDNIDSLFQFPKLRLTNLFKNGLLSEVQAYDNNGNLLAKDSLNYEFHELPGQYQISHLPGRNGIIKKQFTVSTVYNDNGTGTIENEIHNDEVHYNTIYKKTISTDSNTTEEFIEYPVQQSRLWKIRDIPLITETKRNGITISKSETKYEDTSHYFPTSQVSYLPDNLSQSVKNASYDIYDDKGNLVQYTELPGTGTGKSTTIIWGYHKTMPIAKIEGARLADIPAGVIAAIVNASNADADATLMQETATELALIAALNTFRTDAALKNYQITCYTYDPLIGVTNTIPPSGIMETYQYDSFNRLYRVSDANGVTLKEYQYNYKD